MKKQSRRMVKKTTASIMAAAMLCTAVPAKAIVSLTASAATTVSGDLDGDGSLTNSDVKILQDAILGKKALSSDVSGNADVTGDGVINGFDLSRLRQMVMSTDPVSDVIYIHLSDSGITVEGDTNGVTSISSDGKTVTIMSSGTYYVDGSITDGQIYINTDESDTDSVDLYMTDVSMTTSTGAPCIYAVSADKVKITLYGTNTLTDTSTATATDTNGIIDAECDLTITKNSTGSLEVTSSYNTGIYSKDDIKLNGGTIIVNTDEADDADADAIKCKNTLEVDDATVTIDSSADGLKSTKEDVVITSGTISINAGNDAIQAATDITITDGTVVACDDRGLRLDEGGTLNITSGSVLATGTDYGVNLDSSETYDVSGSTQTIMQFSYVEEQSKNTTITLQQNGSTVYSVTPIKKYDYVLISDSSLSSSGTYTQYTGGTQMTHSGSTDGTFANSGAMTDYLEVQALSGGGTITTDDDVATALVYASSSVTAYNASGSVISDPSNVAISGTTATVTLESEIDVSGSCSNGQLVVNVDKDTYSEAQVVLNLTGLTLTNSSSAAIFVEAIGDEVQLVAKNGTENTISDGSSYSATDSTGDTIAAAIYSCDDLKIKGKGTLTVNDNYSDGIVCKNDLKLWNGTLNINAVDDGVRGNDSVRIGDPDDTDYSSLVVNINTNSYNNSGTGGDGIKTKSTDDDEGYVTINGGTVNIDAYADGIQAKQTFTMNDGSLNITTFETSTYSGSSSSSGRSSGFNQRGNGDMEESKSNSTDNSCKGIKAVGRFTDEDAETTTYADQGNLYIYGGTIVIDSSDDCLHCGGDMTITGGTFTLASGDDAMHSDHSLTIGTSGAGTYDDVSVYVSAYYEGVEGATINQNSGTVYVISSDDGYNAAGGTDSSGSSSTSPGGGFSQGGMSTSSGTMNLNGGLVVVNSSIGDNDGFDSNGTLTINGGYYCANGNEPLDYESSYTNNGGSIIKINGGGNTNLTTRYTFCDSSGNVIVSFLSASGGSAETTNCTAYSGGTYTAGTSLLAQSSYDTYAGGTLSNGTTLSSSSSGGNTSGPGGNW